MRKAATLFEGEQVWDEAAECWAWLEEYDRAAECAKRLGDVSLRAGYLLAGGQSAAALEQYEALLAGGDPGDLSGQIEGHLGAAEALHQIAAEQHFNSERRPYEEKAGEHFRAARALLRGLMDERTLTVGRLWERLGAYGGRVGREDLLAVGYEQALSCYGADRTARERALRAYLAGAKENRLLAQRLEAALAELTTAPAPQRQWEQWRDEL
ncbi:MAG: hypothetical protein GY797_21195, partial [Deltaproteobacteria bacterium]|nr:hypothetical protein [Deltaproteobacteria bacterium]